jgi:pimeloyl-ACP methyl ester carboxylesterase
MNRSALIFILAIHVLCIAGCTRYSNPAPDVSSDLLTYENSSGSKEQAVTKEDWETKRNQILEGMEKAMGALPELSGLPALDIQITDSLRRTNHTRFSITFTAAENENVPAYLYVPARTDAKKKFPAMVVLHGTGDLGKRIVDGESPRANRAIAKELAERGYVVIAPDYPSMGDLKDYDFNNDRYQSGTMKAIFNHMRCVDLLQQRDDVDPERIGVIGHSLGGHNAMFAGAFDERLKVIVSSCGWTLMDYYDIGETASKRYGGRLGPWAQDRYMPLLRDEFKLDSTRMPFDFDEVIAALAPRPFFSNSPLNDGNFDVKGVREGIAAAKEVYGYFDAADNLQVAYPEAEHDFPAEVRLQAYLFIDKALKHTPEVHEIK